MKVEPQIKQKRKSLRQKLKSTKKRRTTRTQKKEDELTEEMLYDAHRLNEKLKEMQDLGKRVGKIESFYVFIKHLFGLGPILLDSDKAI